MMLFLKAVFRINLNLNTAEYIFINCIITLQRKLIFIKYLNILKEYIKFCQLSYFI